MAGGGQSGGRGREGMGARGVVRSHAACGTVKEPGTTWHIRSCQKTNHCHGVGLWSKGTKHCTFKIKIKRSKIQFGSLTRALSFSVNWQGEYRILLLWLGSADHVTGMVMQAAHGKPSPSQSARCTLGLRSVIQSIFSNESDGSVHAVKAAVMTGGI